MHNYDTYCNNCGKNGHQFYQCKIPITSFGVIAFRINPLTYEGNPTHTLGQSCGVLAENSNYEFLMIRRKDTLGYIDFMRGKYTLHNTQYIMNMLKQMTIDEKDRLRNGNFSDLWRNLWGDEAVSTQYKSEESNSREKYNALKAGIMIKSELYTLDQLLDESMQYQQWTEPEWGFPKGRRNNQEKDYECAIREFSEETGYNSDLLKNIHNIIPFEENFSGSNYKSYKHKYYLMNISYLDSLTPTVFENTEVSAIGWKSIEDCISCIRPYNLEKIKMISKIHECLTTNMFYFI
jgi:8-oxo-dGTP pyrophosphatase MutT (NUDIX family)